MRVAEIMTANPASCTGEMPLQSVAQLMVDQNCGAIPVIDTGEHAGRVIGVITDRDVAIRAVAAGKCPVQTQVQETMSHPVASIEQNASVEECLKLMEHNQLRRMPVVDQSGILVGIVAQADIARQMDGQVGALVYNVSKGFGR